MLPPFKQIELDGPGCSGFEANYNESTSFVITVPLHVLLLLLRFLVLTKRLNKRVRSSVGWSVGPSIRRYVTLSNFGLFGAIS